MNWMIKRHPAVLSGPNLPKLKRKHVYNIVNLTVIYVTGEYCYLYRRNII